MSTKYLGIFVLMALVAAPAMADVIYEQTYDGAFAYSSDWESQQIADDFVLQEGAATITDIHWWGAYVPFNTPQAVDDFTILIWEDDGGTPASLAVLNLNVGEANRTDTGSDVNGFDLYSYSVDISPLALTAGTTYWISILNDTTGDGDTWGWARSSSSGGLFSNTPSVTGDASDWFQGASVAYQLTNDNLVVPEPGTMTLLGLGLAGLALRRRRATRS